MGRKKKAFANRESTHTYAGLKKKKDEVGTRAEMQI